MTTTALPPGIYRITVAVGVQPACLTRDGDKRVTILPPSAQSDPDQEWRIARGKDGNILIERPSLIRPSSYLTYDGKLEPGARIIYRLSEFPFHEWHLAIAPGFRSFIRVAGSDLGIKVAPHKIHPPFLELGVKDQLQWVFERVRDDADE